MNEKAVLISIHPKWCELIASGLKTVEIRKTKPKLTTPFKVYIYRTKGTVKHLCNGKWWDMPVGGNVIGEFVCDKIVDISYKDLIENFRRLTHDIIVPSCLIKLRSLEIILGIKTAMAGTFPILLSTISRKS